MDTNSEWVVGWADAAPGLGAAGKPQRIRARSIPRLFELRVDTLAFWSRRAHIQDITGIETVSTHPAPSDLVVSSTF
jgi:hypothetical protein